MVKKVKKQVPRSRAETVGSDLSAKYNYVWLMAILIVTFIVFIPAIKNQFITFDDQQYVVENSIVREITASNLKTIFTGDANNLGNYHPLTILSLAANYAISGLNPSDYHLTNILLHLVNTLLVFQLAMQLFIRLKSNHKQLLSSIAALLFGIHPLHVESVAWVSGRKDLLYTCFYLLSLLSYIRYLDKRSIRYYVLSLLFFVFSLLSKGMAVTLAFSVVVVDYFYNRDMLRKAAILDKIPFFVLALVFGIIAVLVQQAQGATDIIKHDFFQRIIFASYGFTQYLVKFLVPYNLCGYYPYPELNAGSIPGIYFLSLIPVVLSICALLYFLLVRPNRTIVFGALFFMINVVFVIQLFPVGSAVMADRYTYLSSFGIFFLMASGMGFLLRKFTSFRVVLLMLFIAYAGVISAISNQRCAVWHDSYSFWQDVMAKNPRFYPAINNLGVFNEEDGNTSEALALFNNSIQVNEQNPEAYFHRGSIYGKSGRLQEAISDFDQAIRYSPEFTKAYINRAIAKAMSNDSKGALSDLDRVLGKGKNEEAYFNRGILKNDLMDYPGAISDFQEAITLNPSCAKCYHSLGLANYYAKRYHEAVTSFSACIRIDTIFTYAYYYRAMAYIASGNPDSSCPDLQKAVNLGMKEAVPYLEKYCRH